MKNEPVCKLRSFLRSHQRVTGMPHFFVQKLADAGVVLSRVTVRAELGSKSTGRTSDGVTRGGRALIFFRILCKKARVGGPISTEIRGSDFVA